MNGAQLSSFAQRAPVVLLAVTIGPPQLLAQIVAVSTIASTRPRRTP